MLDQVDRLPSAVPTGRTAHVETAAATASGAAAQLTLRAVSRYATRGGLPVRCSGARCIQSSPRTAAELSSAHRRSMSNPRLRPVGDSARPCANDETRRRPARHPKASASAATSLGGHTSKRSANMRPRYSSQRCERCGQWAHSNTARPGVDATTTAPSRVWVHKVPMSCTIRFPCPDQSSSCVSTQITQWCRREHRTLSATSRATGCRKVP